MTQTIESFLRTHGPCLSTDVSEHLVTNFGLSPAAARQRISRARGTVRRLAYLTFPHRARFLYLQKHFGSPMFLNRLVSCLQNTNSAYGIALAALQARNGVVPRSLFGIVSGSPIRLRKHLSFEHILENLTKAQLVKHAHFPGIGECVTLSQEICHYEFLLSTIRARLIAESILVSAIKRWLQDLGFVSYHRIATRDGDRTPSVGPYYWDLTAPSYLSFMTKRDVSGTVKPGFVVCDILLGHSVNAQALQPFLTKCRTLRSLKNLAPSMQMFVADRYTSDAFTLAKKQGIIPATTRNLFGSEVAEGLIELISVLSSAGERSVEPEKFNRLFRDLGKLDGVIAQLRGVLFEFIVADIARKTISPNIRMNQNISLPDGKRTEADVIAITENRSVRFIECKGYNPSSTIPDKHVYRWLHHNVPVLYKHCRNHPDWRDLTVRFELWSTGSLSVDAKKAIESTQAQVRSTRYTLGVNTASDILSLCKSANDTGLINVFQTHYMVQ